MKLHSNEERALKYAIDHELFTSNDSDVHGNHLKRLFKNGFLIKVDKKFNVYKISNKGRELIESGDYEISNKCIVCGKIHNKSTKTCSPKCLKEIERQNIKSLKLMVNNYPEVCDMFRNWLIENDYPMFIGTRKVIGTVNHGILQRTAYRVLYSVLEDEGYVKYNSNRTYILKSALK